MINIRTLDVLLRTFDNGTSAARPAAPVAAVGLAAAVGARIMPPDIALLQPIVDDADATSRQGTRGGASLADANAAPSASTAGPRRATSASLLPPVAERDAASAIEMAEDASAPLRLSPAARLVGELVRETAGRSEQAALRGATPLLASPPLTAEPLAHALSAAIGNSGLFYESHLAEWALQQRPQAELANEPQAAWTRGAGMDGNVPVNLATADGGAPQVLQPGNAHTDAALPLVRHQLHALETRQVAWDGDVWPGQRAEIHIAQDEQGDGGAATSAWRTHLRLELPSLGQLDVTLALQGGSLRLQVRTEDMASARDLLSSRRDLLAAMQQRSLAVTGLSIGHERDE